jgi:hypothetical protein
MDVSLNDICSFVEDVHVLTSNKGVLFRGANRDLPLNGLYVFFEAGQKIVIKSREFDRIVRIGINEKGNNFRKRIRGHYQGNIEGSVFRENIGWALLESRGKKPHETYRTKKNYKKQNSGGALEREISDYFSNAFTYKAFKIDYDKLKTYEDVLIAAFSVYYQLKAFKKELDMENWLGRYSQSQQNRIKRTGLWNSEGVLLISESSLSSSVQIAEKTISLSELNMVLRDLTQNIV